MSETYINGKVLTQRHFRDERYDRTITELELYNEYVQLRDNNETDAETFEGYVRNCTSKNGTLVRIR